MPSASVAPGAIAIYAAPSAALSGVAVLASIDALAHSYAGCAGGRCIIGSAGGRPAEIDVFLIAGELALYGRTWTRGPGGSADADHPGGPDLGPDRVVSVAAADAEQRRSLDHGDGRGKTADLIPGERGIHDWVPHRVANDVLHRGREDHGGT